MADKYSVNMDAAELSICRASLVRIARSGSVFLTSRAVRLGGSSCSIFVFFLGAKKMARRVPVITGKKT